MEYYFTVPHNSQYNEFAFCYTEDELKEKIFRWETREFYKDVSPIDLAKFVPKHWIKI